MNRTIPAALAGTVLAISLTPSMASATETKTPKFEAYETTVCWAMDNSDGIEGTYEWPQTRSGCDILPACGELIEFQVDTYWIRDKADEKYLAGLQTLNSPDDDAQLEPHAYYSKLVKGDDCAPVIPEQPADEVTRTHEDSEYVCGDDHVTRTITTTRTPIDVYDETTNTWLPGEPVVKVRDKSIAHDVEDCPVIIEEPPVVVPPVVEPPADVPPVTDTPSVDEPKAQVQVKPLGAVDTGAVLPNTGGPSVWVLVAAGWALAAGSILLVWTRAAKAARRIGGLS